MLVFIISVASRLKSVKNIQKITKSMKMVSAAKFAKAERELKPARTYGAGANGTYFKKTRFLLQLVYKSQIMDIEELSNYHRCLFCPS